MFDTSPVYFIWSVFCSDDYFTELSPILQNTLELGQFQHCHSGVDHFLQYFYIDKPLFRYRYVENLAWIFMRRSHNLYIFRVFIIIIWQPLCFRTGQNSSIPIDHWGVTSGNVAMTTRKHRPSIFIITCFCFLCTHEIIKSELGVCSLCHD